jgi:hypothetical protein
MADKKIPSLNALADPQPDDLLVVVDDTLNVPVNKKISIGSLFNKQSLNTSSTSTFSKLRTKRDINVRRDINLRNETLIEQPVALSVSGLNDITASGTFTGTVSSVYIIEIDAIADPPGSTVDTFKWTKDGFIDDPPTDGVSITGSAQTLSDGVAITFAATTGHTVGDNWYVTALPQSRIDFGVGHLLAEDPNLTTTDISDEGNLLFESGVDIRLEAGTVKDVYITANTTTLQLVGDNQLGGSATDKLGFFGTAPVAKNESTGSTITAIRAELVRLGLIA